MTGPGPQGAMPEPAPITEKKPAVKKSSMVKRVAAKKKIVKLPIQKKLKQTSFGKLLKNP